MRTERSRKIIVAVAPVGTEILPPSVNPLTPQDVASEVVACAEAGASMVHLHVRDSEGNQTEDMTAFSETLDLIRESSDIIIQGSTGGLTSLSLEERCVSVTDHRVEVASLNMGSVNFGEDVYVNRLPDIRYWARRMEEAGVAPEMEIFEMGMIPVTLKFIDEGVIKPPYHFNFILGAHWAMPADPRSLFYLSSMLDKDMPWGLVQDGMMDLSLQATAIGLGASVVRVGFEDSVYFAPGKFAKTNKELVKRLASLIYQIGFEVAEPDEARKLLGLN
jgi:3-keto-5-aminohexanoate cleavage enzyme